MNKIYVNKAELKKSTAKINDILQINISTEGKMLNILSELQENIKINYKTIDNKEDEINYNIRTFQNNCKTCVRKLENTINMYVEARDNAVDYVNKKIGEIR